ncbi:hypothetical protein BDQ17DRAFT_1250282, partial [Cyathus striatus]
RSLVNITALICVFHAIAVVSTALRLSYRKYAHRLWWDDLWAFLGLVFIIPFWILYMTADLIPSTNQHLVIFWRLAHVIVFTVVLWCARLSVAVTIVRILPEGMFRRCAKMVSAIFALMCTALIVQKFSRCGVMSLAKLAYCKTPRWTATLELSTDVVADVWLIFSPAYMLYKTHLRSNHRRLIIAIFACGFLTTIASIVHCIYIYLNKVQEIAISGHIQAATSVVVCNLLVLVTYLYRAYQRGRTLTDASETETDEVRGIRTVETRSRSSSNRIWSLTNVTFTEISTEASSRSAQDEGTSNSSLSSDGTGGVLDKIPSVYTLPMRSSYPQRTNTWKTV